MKKSVSSVFCVLVFFSIAGLSFARDIWLNRAFPTDPLPYPTVVSITPAHGAVVPVGSSIVIQFSMQMDRSSVENEVGIEDQYENFVPGTFIWSTTVFSMAELRS